MKVLELPKGACCLALSAVLATAGCASPPMASPGPAAAATYAGLGQASYADDASAPYILRRSDIIRITVFREEALSLESVAISAEGRVSMPLVGPVDAAGMTLDQLEGRIEQLLGDRFLRDPDVAVNVVEYVSHQVTVEGSIEEPGIYPFLPGTRLSGGIALANGMRRESDINDVAVFRETPEGMMIAKFDFAAVRAGTMLDPILMPGDRVVVGTNGLSQFWQDMLKALPVFALFTQI